MRTEVLLWALVFSVPTGLAAAIGVIVLADDPLMGVLFGGALAAAIFALVVVGGRETGDRADRAED